MRTVARQTDGGDVLFRSRGSASSCVMRECSSFRRSSALSGHHVLVILVLMLIVLGTLAIIMRPCRKAGAPSGG